MAAAAASLFERESEMQLIDELIDHVHDRGGALLVSGEPGIGKSALLVSASLRATGRGMRVLKATGLQAEAPLAFAGLHQLLQPVLDDIDELAGPQRDAMLAAFGRIDAPAPDLFLTALAALDMLAEAAAESPVLVIAEDAHWLDRSTADVLAFIARRLEYEPILLLAAIRDGFDSPLEQAALPAVHLEALGPAAAGALLDDAAPGMSPDLRHRVLDEAAGNPLALVELPVAFGQQGERARLPAWLPLTTRLQRAFAARLVDLPASTRTALLVAALNDSSSVSEVLAASSRLIDPDVTLDTLVPAVPARLAELDDFEIVFRHPLTRSAILEQASISQRQAAQAALADVLTDQPERSVWHRAASVIGPNEAVACELEALSWQAHRRGAIAVSVAALERAAKLSGPSKRAGRLLRAAELAFELGRHDVVFGLMHEADRLDLGPFERARVAWIRDSFTDGIPREATPAHSLAAFADRAATDGDTDLALKLLNRAALQCWWADPGPAVREQVVVVAEGLDVNESDGRLLQALACAAPIDRGAKVYAQLSALVPEAERDPAASRLLGNAATAVGAFDLAAGLLATSIDGLRVQGRLGLLARALAVQSSSAAHLANLSIAIPAAEEGVRLGEETNQPHIAAMAQVTQVMVAALRGDTELVDALTLQVESVCVPIGASGVLAELQLARGVAALGAGRHAEAYEHLRRIYKQRDPAYHIAVRCFAIGDLAEAGVRSAHAESIQSIVEELESVAQRTPSPLLHAGLAYARPLLAGDEHTEPAFHAALDTDLTHWPFLRGRVLLAYGEWLRQRRRNAQSRAPLRSAREIFDALGAIPWGERARQQLRATGETSRRRTPEARDELTPQELQIAQSAARGLTNREIGQMLYLSHRTISSHLYRTFPKLGITSRAELRDVLEHGVGELA